RNPFFTEFATSLQMALADRGYATVIANTDESAQTQAQVVSAMIEHGVSALIISPTYGETSAVFDAIERADIPAMQVLRKVDTRTNRFPFAAPDYVNGSRLAAKHLLEQGAEKIAFVGGLEGRDVTSERMSGFLSELKDSAVEPLIFTGQATRHFGRKIAKHLAQEHPLCDAELCFNDLVALGLIVGCHELGRRIGNDLKIVGFDDIEEASESWPQLTSVHCGIAEFGESIAETMLAWLEEGYLPKAQIRTPVTLKIRDSSRQYANEEVSIIR
ncbi:MAG: substrate-binding domain-containing protein, partial [Pseudomonadota bacterium]